MSHAAIKGVILIGGPSKGTRFRPLSLSSPKPLFPIAGKPMIYHQIRALSQVPGLTEIFLIGVWDDKVIEPFLKETRREFKNMGISYLREFKAMGTAGGLYHFRDVILRNSPDQIFVLNADICSSFPLKSLQEFHSKHRGVGTIMGKKVPKGQELRFGSIVVDQESRMALHYVEKPEGFISDVINTGVYLFDQSIFSEIKTATDEKARIAAEDPTSEPDEIIHLEQDVITRLASSRKLFVYETIDFWQQIKSAGSALPANALYLSHLSKTSPGLLTPPTARTASSPEITGAVSIDPTAQIHPSAKIGPNVSIGPNVIIGEGARVYEAILLEGVELGEHAVVGWGIVGRDSKIGAWGRVDGAPEDAAALKPKKTIAILADEVNVSKEVYIRSCIVLPQKILNKSACDEVLL
ncbi:GDP-mannose pyrophosphorylase [Phaffia rhodozyma]|uniref:mannose-1-phosphate guanylyltransferase n=1 Tax=Phaffia rhodozyma TaxID=264483 RepID=A0A0F7SLT4_PHARH|nr:GDP-mannose pyrophosphorylase [Phaffia rhodozyma]